MLAGGFRARAWVCCYQPVQWSGGTGAGKVFRAVAQRGDWPLQREECRFGQGETNFGWQTNVTMIVFHWERRRRRDIFNVTYCGLDGHGLAMVHR